MSIENSWELLPYLDKRRKDLDRALLLAKERGIALAEAEKIYRIEKRKAFLQAQHNGIRATLIRDYVNGDEKISELRYRRDVAKTLYDNAVEAINVYKLDCRLIENQIARDWNAM